MRNHVIIVFVDGNRLVRIHRHRDFLKVRVEALAQNLRQEYVHAFRHLASAGIDNAGTEEVEHLAVRDILFAISKLAVPFAGHLFRDVAELEVRFGEASHVVREVFRNAVQPKFVPGFKELAGFGSIGRIHHSPVENFVVQNRRKAHHLRISENLFAVDGLVELHMEIEHGIDAALPFFWNREVAYDGDIGIHVEEVAINHVAHHRLQITGAEHRGKLFIEFQCNEFIDGILERSTLA